jgi:hypothetical protein
MHPLFIQRSPRSVATLVRGDAHDMNAGRELDALVAEHIMGWDLIAAGGLWRTANGSRMLPNFSADMAAALMVVDQMRVRGYELDLHHKHVNCYGRPDPRWTHTHAIFRGNADGGAIEITPAHAICRAALRALGIVTVEAHV